MVVLVTGIMLLGLQQRIDQREQQAAIDNTVSNIQQIALAQYRYTTDPNNTFRGNYGHLTSGNQDSLIPDYLPAWTDLPGDPAYNTAPLTPLTGFTITWNPLIAGGNLNTALLRAREVQSRIPNLSTVDPLTALVTVEFAHAFETSLLDVFVNKDGDSMRGNLDFLDPIATPPIRHNIQNVEQLDANTINANLVTVEDGGAGRINVDTIDADSALIGELTYTTP